MRILKLSIGYVLIVCGVALGLYMGIWWALIGGIIDVVQAVKADDIVPIDLATGIAKVMCCTIVGFASAIIVIIPAGILLDSATKGTKLNGYSIRR